MIYRIMGLLRCPYKDAIESKLPLVSLSSLLANFLIPRLNARHKAVEETRREHSLDLTQFILHNLKVSLRILTQQWFSILSLKDKG
jgi:hypothetical protein